MVSRDTQTQKTHHPLSFCVRKTASEEHIHFCCRDLYNNLKECENAALNSLLHQICGLERKETQRILRV